MLGKLIKHEFRATARYMWPIMGGMLLLALLVRFVANPVLTHADNFILNTLGVIIVMLFTVGCMALGLAPLCVSGCEFKRSILGSEGYLTMSLPVSSRQHINAKLITNAVWYALTGVLMVLILLVMVGDKGTLPGLSSGFTDAFDKTKLSAEDAQAVGHLILACIEGFIDLIAGASLLTVAVYAAYAIGYSANRRKELWTVLLIYLFFHVVVWVGLGSLFIIGRSDMKFAVDALNNVSVMKAFEGFLGLGFLIMVALGAVFYHITDHFITKKLNLV